MLIFFILLAVAASIASLIGYIWLVVEAFRESTTWGVLVLLGMCCCIPVLIFVFKHWEVSKKPFALYLGGWLLSMPGSVMMQVEAQRGLVKEFQAQQQREERRLQLGGAVDPDAVNTTTTEPEPDYVRPDWAIEAEKEQAKAKEPKEVVTEASVLFKVRGSAEEQLLALKTWRREQLDRAEGARLKMLTALGLPLEPHIRKIILESLSEHPLDTTEALNCLTTHKLPEALRTPILKELCRSGTGDSERVAEVMAQVEETGTLLVEETLARMRHPKPGALGRLLSNRGHEWAKSPVGMEVLTLLARDATELEPLINSEREDLRGLACELVAKSEDQKAALKILVARLKDEAPSVRQRAATAIEARGDPAVTWYLALAISRETDDGVRTVLVRTLRALPLDKTVAYLRTLYKKKNPKARIAAVEGARALRSYSATQIMLKALRDKDTDVLLKALESLEATANDSKLKQSCSPGLLPLQILSYDPTKTKEVNRLAKRIYFSLSGRIPKRLKQ